MTTSGGLAAGDIVAGKYRVERIVGEGGMGVVVAAWHTELEQHVAIKLLTEDALKNRVVVERFEREARAAVKIKSRHVARVSDVGKLDDGSPYMVMEFLEGQDLEAIVEKEGSMAIVRAVDCVLQACDAIAEAHAYGIVHRDLKPANLFLADTGGSNEIKVLDFGISKSMKGTDGKTTGKGLTQAHEVFGSPMYMSPEQLSSTAMVDARADIWSLGIILYELCTGNPPFHLGTVAEIWSGILDKPIPPPSQRRPSLPVELEKAIMKALTRDVSKRWQTVADFAEAIAPFGTGDAQPCVDRAKKFRDRMAGAATMPEARGTGAKDAGGAKPVAVTVEDPPLHAGRASRPSEDGFDITFEESEHPPPESAAAPPASVPRAPPVPAIAGAPAAPAPGPRSQAQPLPRAPSNVATRADERGDPREAGSLRSPRPLSSALDATRRATARTTTDWQSVPPPKKRSKTPTVLIGVALVGAIGGSVYFLRTRTGASDTPAASSAPKAATSSAPADTAASSAAITAPDEPTASAQAAPTRPYGYKWPPAASASARPSASAAASASAAPAVSASAPAEEPSAEEPPPPPPMPKPPPGPLPTPGAD